MGFQRADFSQLHGTGYGIGFHWISGTYPREGKPLPYCEAVEAFDVDTFVKQALETGAGHMLFTTTHARQCFPGPHPEIERILPGRTCQRDLIMEIADGLAAAGIKLMVYYNQGICGHDPEWMDAVGVKEPDHSTYYDNYCSILNWIGKHYGPKVIGYWIDGGYDLDRLGDVPWQRLYEASKVGYANRLLCWNAGIEEYHLYTPYQDYWAGEVVGLEFRPSGALTQSGLPWHAFVDWYHNPDAPECGQWGIWSERDRHLERPLIEVDQVIEFLQAFRDLGGAVTFNLLCYQDGSVLETDLQVMREVKKIVRSS